MDVKELFKQAEKILSLTPKEKRSYHIGSGTQCDAYKFHHESEFYVVKYFHGKTNFSCVNDIELSIPIYERGINIANMAKYIGASINGKFIIQKFVDGLTVDKIEIRDIDQEILLNAMNELIQTCCELNENELQLDPDPSNFIYNDGSFYLFDVASITVDNHLYQEVLKIPEILCKDLNDLLYLSPIFLKALTAYINIEDAIVKYTLGKQVPINNLELVRPFTSFEELTERQNLINKYIQFAFHTETNYKFLLND